MEFSDHQRLFLAAVCKHFHETGTWPTYGFLDKSLRQHRGLDVEEVGKELDGFMHDSSHAPPSGWDPKQTITMNVSALTTCQATGIYPGLETDLGAFIQLISLCIDRFERGEDEEPITSGEFLELLIENNLDELENMVAGAYQLILVEGFYVSAALSSNNSTPWTFTLPRSIRKYRDVTNIEEYLAVRANLLRSSLNSYGAVPSSSWPSQLPRDIVGLVELVDGQLISAATTNDTSQQADTWNANQRGVSKPKIFVSHSSKDATFASKLVNHLKAAGADAWMDVNDLGAGNFQQGISKALDECEWFILVLTQNALDSQWVLQEVDAANRLKNQGQIRNLIFIKADAGSHKVPPLWGVYNILDGVADYGMALIRTLKAVGLLSAT